MTCTSRLLVLPVKFLTVDNRAYSVADLGRFYVWAGGARAPLRFTCCPLSHIQKLADRSYVISEVPKCSNIQIFRGLAPLKTIPPSLLALWASFLRVLGSNPLQNWQPY